MNKDIVVDEKELQWLKSNLKKIRSQIEYYRPITYWALKEYSRQKVDATLKNYYYLQIRPFYEKYLTVELIEKISNTSDFKLSFEIYNLIVVKEYRKLFLKKFPNNHPAIIGSKIFAFTTVIASIIFLISCIMLVLNGGDFLIGLIFGIIVGIGSGFILGIIFQKVYLTLTFKKFYWNRTYF